MPEEGLRERKKRQTENAIEIAAVRIALRDGFVQVTVREICALAEISRATFFNYMPTREAAIFGKPIELIEAESAERTLAAASTTDAVSAVYVLLLASVGHTRMNPAVARGRARLAMEQPGALELIKNQYARISTQLTVYLSGWLSVHPEYRRLPEASVLEEASLAVGVGMTAMGAVFAVQEDAPGDIELSTSVFRAQLDAIERLAAPGVSPAARPDA
ncbi:TetR family transcriptional regulator [uncultured Microbacterium sp.]|uniref:TetR/AcrR family transcriptional regulator n=1 Tax=uncultured Microbacterium sp. TaxID=191216 RepID=UPI0028E6F7DD|nr:TetR family transcriptional regulator [uncultured Microbacterium sp.]